MPRILLTGFEAFAGRQRNASWLAVQGLLAAAHRPSGIALRSLQLPVRWGQPRPLLRRAIADWQPQQVISLGEGKPGHFAIETLARKQRGERADNRGRFPLGQTAELGGPALVHSSANTAALVARLAGQQLPVIASSDAGAFLCEETLYGLERLKDEFACVQQVLFVHLPPWQTPLNYRGEQQLCEEALLLDFTRRLLQASIEQPGS